MLARPRGLRLVLLLSLGALSAGCPFDPDANPKIWNCDFGAVSGQECTALAAAAKCADSNALSGRCRGENCTGACAARTKPNCPAFVLVDLGGDDLYAECEAMQLVHVCEKSHFEDKKDLLNPWGYCHLYECFLQCPNRAE